VAEVPQDSRILESVKNTADILGGITTWQVYRLLEAGEIESRYIGKRRLVVVASLQEYINNLPTTRETA
jgi:hypothetical protein